MSEPEHEQLLRETEALLERVELPAAELATMVDVLSDLLGSSDGPCVRLAEPVLSVLPGDGDAWHLVRVVDGFPSVEHTEADRSAVEGLARSMAREASGTVVVHRADGGIQSTHHFDES